MANENRFENERFNETKFHPDPSQVHANTTYFGVVGALDLLNKLVLTMPGHDPMDADLGVGIAQYEFKRLNSELIRRLRTKITEQARTYINNEVEIDITLSDKAPKRLIMQMQIPGVGIGAIQFQESQQDGKIVFQSFLN